MMDGKKRSKQQKPQMHSAKSEIRKPVISESKDTNVSMPEFFDGIASIVEQARSFAGRTADVTMCAAYYEIGRRIIVSEQDGEIRARYGRGIIKELSAFLNARFGKGFSESTLKYARQFYTIYSGSIRQTMFDESGKAVPLPTESWIAEKSQTVFSFSNPFRLSWSHYIVLMKIKNEDERRFYEIEAINEQWTLEQLKRQYGSSLYERLALSRDKDEVMRLAKEGQTMNKPRDMLKNPLVLEFYGLEQMPSYSESDLESAIIANLQRFLLELGKGFLFEARQKRFSFDEKSFFVDLVFYNRVELTLPKDTNIHASEYSLYLPDKALLQRKLAEWAREFEEEHGGEAE